MVRTKFDHLPNELVLNILGYLTTLDAWFAFYNLNTRLNKILQSHVTHFHLTHCRRSRLDFISQCVLSGTRNPFSISFSLRPIVGSADRMFD